MENSALNYVNKPPLEAWNVWIWRICAAISGILSGVSLLHPLFAWLAWLAPAGFLFSMLLDPHKPLREYLWRAALFAVHDNRAKNRRISQAGRPGEGRKMRRKRAVETAQ